MKCTVLCVKCTVLCVIDCTGGLPAWAEELVLYIHVYTVCICMRLASALSKHVQVPTKGPLSVVVISSMYH